MSPIGFQYFVTFVDDYSRKTLLYLIKNRLELCLVGSPIVPSVLKFTISFMFMIKI